MTRRAGLLLVGLYVCLLGAVVHRHVWHAREVSWPWGLVLVVVVTGLVAVAAAGIVRTGAAWFALGWAIGLMGLQWSPGGSYLVASDWLGWAFTGGCLGGIVLVVLCSPRLAP